MHFFTKLVLLAASFTVSAAPCQHINEILVPLPDLKNYPYRFEVFETPNTGVSNRLMITALAMWTNVLRRESSTTPIPPEGLVLPISSVGLYLTVKQEGDKKLIREDVEIAIKIYGNSLPRSPRDTVPLKEVHILTGFYLQGTVNVTMEKPGEGMEDFLQTDLREALEDVCEDKVSTS